MPSTIFGFPLQDIHVFLLLCGASIGVFGLAVCINWLHSRKAAIVCCILGSIFIIGAILTSGRRWLNDTAVGLYGFLFTLSALGLYMYFKEKQTSGDVAQKLINKLSKSEILYPIGTEITKGHCWCCGEITPDIQHVRLLRMVFVLVAIGGEELTVPVPVCASHGDISQGLLRFSKKYFKLKHLSSEANAAVILFENEDVAELVREELDSTLRGIND